MNILEQLLELTDKKHATLEGRLLMIGYGAVGQSMLPLVLRHVSLNPYNITVIELGEHRELFNSRYPAIKYIAKEIVKDNLDSELSKHVGPGDFLINVSLNIDGVEIVKWCLEHGVMYIDTSIERWKTQPDETIPKLAERTLYHTHQRMRGETSAFKGTGPTCVVTHGANPGMVTHFTKAALLDLARELGIATSVPQSRDEWARLMQSTGTKVIHICERDTQVIDKPKVKGEFVNTWSCEGFWAEGRAPAELGWGTHEDVAPVSGFTHAKGPRNAVYIDRPGVATLIKSWVPLGGSYNGFLIQHSEAITISDYFTVMKGTKAIYRPTVHYVYQPCDAAIVSIHEFRGRELQMQDVKRIAKDEITRGIDELGVMLMGHDKNAWWYGSQLGIEEARKLIPHENATTIQVAAPMLGAMVWMLKNPTMGYLEPEDLPFDQVLEIALPYLGPMKSMQSDWTPLEERNILFKKLLNRDHPWRFENFRVWS